jgi:hypothetical protein
VYNLQQFIEKAAGSDRQQGMSFADCGFLSFAPNLAAARDGKKHTAPEQHVVLTFNS